MKKPVLFIVTKKIIVYYAFRDKLRQIFGNDIQIVTNHFPPVNLNEIDLILSSGSKELEMEYIEPVRHFKPVLIANRSIEFSKLEKLIELPEGTHCLLVSDEKHMAEDSVELLKRMGFDQHEITSYSPDMDCLPSLDGVEVAITHGLKELVPTDVKKIIDLGVRSLDLSTIIEISRVLQLPVEKVPLLTADFFRNFVRIGKKLAYSNHNESRLNQHLETVLNAVHEGIISINTQGVITVFNEQAGRILGVMSEQCINRHYSKVISEFNIDEILESRKEIADQIIQIHERQLLMTKTPIMLNQHFIGVVVTFQDVTYVQRLEQEIRRKKTESGLTTKYCFEDIISRSQEMDRTKEIAKKIAKSDYTVLINGESGTGKELFAQAIHEYSSRKVGPFLAVNFAGLTETLAESELFGYEEGAFTGAKRGGKPGLFELAQNGTIFLDEIGDAPLSIQASLLRVIQERQVMRVGGNKVIPINVRIIAATNKDLQQMIAIGDFREDLFYRLNELPLSIPPLRERKLDIEILFNYFLKEKNRNKHLTTGFVKAMTSYHWPGNVRELVGVINYLTVTVDGNQIGVEHIPQRIMKTENQEHDHQVDKIIKYLDGLGDLKRYMEILECLALYKNYSYGIGRGTLRSNLRFSISDGQLRTKLEALKRTGCVISGIKRQGTKITESGLAVLDTLNSHSL
ncbi:PAS domain S-box-containing protein [Bacillus pakistanensis]|uniref:PAS domain S-box-containing protein n=1 Tax=Rossellomorea pakistanensis TaxID=992288 RepID=A0ABS2NE49_9BACI|nr:sigma 54-interacting transcriptional regulator [Bacillus pakistanensis]MBM7586024.1 PAS domain S-box-containing protein [Bacillus pakistanensis]